MTLGGGAIVGPAEHFGDFGVESQIGCGVEGLECVIEGGETMSGGMGRVCFESGRHIGATGCEAMF